MILSHHEAPDWNRYPHLSSLYLFQYTRYALDTVSWSIAAAVQFENWEPTLETCQNFLRHETYRICWNNAIFYHKFLRQEIDKNLPFKDISWNQKFEKIFFFSMVFWARKLAETIQLFFHCCDHTSEENTAFEMIFWCRKTSKKAEICKYFLMQ